MPFQKGHTINLGRKCSKETKQRMSESHKYTSEESRRKMSIAHKGKKHTEESKKKMSEIRKGVNSGNWKGGKTKDATGYILIHMPKHPFAVQAGYIRHSHLVMEKTLGRHLRPEEIVHHINGIRDDDRPENLQLFPNNGVHTKFHRAKK